MTYLTYGPSPTSLYRVVTTPAGALFDSPLDRMHSPVSGGRGRARRAMRGAVIAGLVLATAGAALILHLAVHVAGRGAVI